MNPWLAFVLGVLIGWLIGWLLELWFSRRRRLECEGRLEEAQAQLRARDAELQSARVRADALESDLGALRVKSSAEAAVPRLSVEAPAVPAPAVEAGALKVQPPEAGAAAVEPGWPDVSAATAEAAAALPSVAAVPPSIGAELPGRGLPEAAAEVLSGEAAGEGMHLMRATTTGAIKSAACPQDLSRVKGIGSVLEAKLYAAGIGSFWELGRTDEAELARILEVRDFQKVDLGAIKAAALQLAAETGTEGRAWDGSQPDDFEPFEGIGEVYEGRLYDAGICTYRALAEATVEQLAEICKAPSWRMPDYAGWIAQAKRLLG